MRFIVLLLSSCNFIKAFGSGADLVPSLNSLFARIRWIIRVGTLLSQIGSGIRSTNVSKNVHNGACVKRTP